MDTLAEIKAHVHRHVGIHTPTHTHNQPSKQREDRVGGVIKTQTAVTVVEKGGRVGGRKGGGVFPGETW